MRRQSSLAASQPESVPLIDDVKGLNEENKGTKNTTLISLWKVRQLLQTTSSAASRAWTSASPRVKIICRVLVGVFLFLLLVDLIDWTFSSYGLDLDEEVEITSTSSKFAVVINTYKRPERLRQAVLHYAQTCGPSYSVGKVFIVWAQLNDEPPLESSFFPSELKFLKSGSSNMQNRSPVSILRVDKDSLNSRFYPIAELDATNDNPMEAIFMVDDDVNVDCSSLQQGFMAWRKYPSKMVGYYPRLASIPRFGGKTKDEFLYQSWPGVFLRQQANFVLTKASFLHKRYLDLYTDPKVNPQEIKDYVDEHMNCEDVAMSMLVANQTNSSAKSTTRTQRSSMIYVEGSVSDTGLFGGISTGTGHMSTRSGCLTDLAKIYSKHGWDAPFRSAVSLREYSWTHHVPGFWWQLRPSNIFEWFPNANVLM